jgi:hypothetical protein
VNVPSNTCATAEQKTTNNKTGQTARLGLFTRTANTRATASCIVATRYNLLLNPTELANKLVTARTTPLPIRPNEIRAIGAAFTGKTVLHPDFVCMDGLFFYQAEELSRRFAAP